MNIVHVHHQKLTVSEEIKDFRTLDRMLFRRVTVSFALQQQQQKQQNYNLHILVDLDEGQILRGAGKTKGLVTYHHTLSLSYSLPTTLIIQLFSGLGWYQRDVAPQRVQLQRVYHSVQ